MMPRYPLGALLFALCCMLSCVAVGQERSTSGPVQISFTVTGDIMQHDSQMAAAKTSAGQYDYSECFRLVQPWLRRSDFTIGNLELTFGGSPYKGYPCFSAPDTLAYALRDAGFNVLTTANNHSCDRRNRGIVRTIEILEKVGLPRTGTFRDSADRARNTPGRGQLHPDLAVAGRELHRVVQQVRDGAFQRGGIAQDRHRLQARVEGDVRSATGCAGQCRLHHLRQVELLRLTLEMVVAGQRHQVTDEGRELTELGGDVVEDFGASPFRQHSGLVVGHQQLNVGAHRRQRGAQLVAGVGDQLSLLLPRSLETLQHQVETARQLTQVVASVDADRVQLVGLGDVLHRGGETTHRGQCGLRHPQGREGRGQQNREHQNQFLHNYNVWSTRSSRIATRLAPAPPRAAESISRSSWSRSEIRVDR